MAVGLFLDQPPQAVCVGQVCAVQAAQRLAHIQDAPAAHSYHHLRGKVPGGLIGLKELLHRGVGGTEHQGTNHEAGISQLHECGQLQHIFIPHQQEDTALFQSHLTQQSCKLSSAARSLHSLHGVIIPVQHAASCSAIRRLISATASGSSQMESMTRSAPASR